MEPSTVSIRVPRNDAAAPSDCPLARFPFSLQLPRDFIAAVALYRRESSLQNREFAFRIGQLRR